MAMSVAAPPVVALGTCPARVVRLRASDLPAAKRAVLAEMPTLAARLDRRGARVQGVRFVHVAGDVLPARPCTALRRSPVFYVARTRAHWVI